MVKNRYIAPEQVPVKYGGLSNEIGGDSVTEAIVKPAAKYTIELPASEVYIRSKSLIRKSSKCKMLLSYVDCVDCGRLARSHGSLGFWVQM